MVGRIEVLKARPELAAVWDAADAQFPVRVPRSYWERIDATDPNDPLGRQALPDPAELVPDIDDDPDPVGDAKKSPIPWVVQKHADRVLLLLTKRCHLYCRYCFRRNHRPEESQDPSPEAWEAAVRYALDSGAQEVILSGGDPLAVSDARVFETIDRLKSAIPVIRVHTRAPITYPARVTPELVAGLRARAPVWLFVHVNHPRELSADVDRALAALVDAGVPVLNQSVLLKGINDDVDVLTALSRALVERRVYPYYLHHTDPAAGNAAFRVSLDDGLTLWRGLARRVSGLGLPRYVIDPEDGSGKVDVASFVEPGAGGASPVGD
jgi:lysine 2,3-aminomutase